MYPITITISNDAELNAVMSALKPTLPTAIPSATAAELAAAAGFDPNSDKTQVIPREVIDAAIKEAKAAAQEKKSAKQEPASTPPTAEKAAAPEQKVESSDNKPASIEYPVLQKAVFALAGKSREAAAAVAASFGVKTFKELDASKWADALAAVNAKIAELEAA